MKQEMKPQVLDRYASIIASIAQNAIINTDGITQEDGLVRYRFQLSALKDRNIHVYIDETDKNVTLDVHVNADMSVSIPEVVCNLQEKIKREVESATQFIVKKINVHVVNITNTTGV